VTVVTAALVSPNHADVAGRTDASPEPTGREDRRERRKATTAALLAQVHDARDDRERQRLRDEVVCLNMEVAEAISARYRRRGVPDDDLAQVAYLGLVKAVHGFDPTFGRDFLSYAVPTIRGEVRKYFRDRAWTVRPPRHLLELQPRVAAAREELGQRLGRSPRAEEVAEHLGVHVEEVIETLSTHTCFSPTSLDQPHGHNDGEDGRTLADLLGREDDGLGAVEARIVLGRVVETLSPRDRRIVYLRFFAQQTQGQIARELGVTQVQVSRLITRILADLRRAIDD
jgi:RNA polymerase sigma-B factor